MKAERGSTCIQVVAVCEPPNLSIPFIINLDYCLVGDAQRSSLQCTDTGEGTFEEHEHRPQSHPTIVVCVVTFDYLDFISLLELNCSFFVDKFV